MDRLIERCAGLDVHKASVKACVRVPAERPGERRSQTRTFRTTTAGLVLLRDWLASHRVSVVGMESTGVVWKPVSDLLEDEFECWLGQRPPSAQRARTHHRRGGRGLDLSAGRARPWCAPRSCHPARSASCVT